MQHGLTYKQLCLLNPDAVVLMTKLFMYEAKNNSARILSYLLGYKLMQNKDGTVICAGPDKDKIVAVLQAHHVNYLISEFGEITANETYKDNGFGKYLSIAQDLPVEPVVPVTKNDKGPGKALVSPETLVSPEKVSMPDWLRPGASVYSRAFGKGIIVAVTEERLTVNFPEAGEKKFVWPDAFNNGYLTKIE